MINIRTPEQIAKIEKRIYFSGQTDIQKEEDQTDLLRHAKATAEIVEAAKEAKARLDIFKWAIQDKTGIYSKPVSWDKADEEALNKLNEIKKLSGL